MIPAPVNLIPEFIGLSAFILIMSFLLNKSTTSLSSNAKLVKWISKTCCLLIATRWYYVLYLLLQQWPVLIIFAIPFFALVEYNHVYHQQLN